MKIKIFSKDTLFLIVGSLMLAIAVNYFIIPFQILSGGVAGLAVAIQPLVQIVSVNTLINIIIIITFFAGWFFLGHEFAAKTIVASILYPLFLELLKFFPLAFTIPVALASLYAGIFYGIGAGLIIKTGSSSGGMDVPPLIIHKYTNIPLSTLIMITDAATILLGIGVFGISAVLIGLISVFVCGLVVDRVLVSQGSKAKTVFIISKKHDIILQEIISGLDRSATILDGIGGYSKKEQPLLLTVVPTEQYPKLEKLVSQIDPVAFMIVQEALEVHGEGFSFDIRI